MSYIKKGFGTNVKLIRKSRNLTQEKLAELIEIDQRQMARIEVGESFVTAETIEKLSAVLNVPVKLLFDIENTETDKMTLEVIETYNKNIKKLKKVMEKAALSNAQTELICLAAEAPERKLARERLRGLLTGLDLK